ncbi:hypothetical protein ABIB15_000859, partial [Marisediminicola sp. UYEF4]|uniref:hypothetical protein n=1 Tax=Marisediminicola sp. UYEF4 TaxID=1756384 RepID=UPI00339A1D34
MRGYRWTAEQAAELAESMLQFNMVADAEMVAKGYRPGAGLPFQGMPAEMFPHDPELDDPELDDPAWMDEHDYPYYPHDPDYPAQLGEAGQPDHLDHPGTGLDGGRGYPFGVAAGAGGPVEAMERVVDALERVERDVAGLLGDRAVLFEQALALGETGTERSRAGSRQLALRSVRAELGAALRIPERTIEGLLGV